MSCDLLGASLGGDMLSTRQRRAATVAGKADEIFGHQRHRAACALLPRRVGRRVDDDLAHGSPTCVVRIAACHQKPRQRLRHPFRSGVGPVTVEVPECGTHAAAAFDRTGELARSPPRLASLIVDRSTVLRREPGPS